MKFKNHSLTSVAFAAILFLSACGTGNHEEAVENEGAAGEETETTSSSINLNESKIMWKGTMVGVYSHEGTLNITDGKLETKGDVITGGNFTVDMSSMKPTDENYNEAEGKTPDKLVGHLSAPEFFDVANHPTATFKITGSEGGKVMGELTIKGSTNTETVENVVYDAATDSWTGRMTVNRKKYGVSWDSPMKEMVLSDDIEMEFHLVR